MFRIKKILAPTDCSKPSIDAMLYAVQMAEAFQADLVVLRVIPSPTEIYDEGILVRDYSFEITPEQIQAVKDFWYNYVGNEKESEFVVLKGDAFDEIIRYSQENAIDMIVMGTHGYTGFKHIFMGSVAEKVVRYSTIPVLTVKQKSFEYEKAGQ